MYLRSSALLALLLGSACGRIGFDAAALDASSSDGGTEDAGIRWEEFQGSGSGEGISNTPGATSQNGRIRIAPNGSVYVLYANDDTGVKDIYLKRWSGIVWEGLGPSASPGGLSNDAATSSLGGVAFDANSEPHVTWIDARDSRSVYYRYWDGAAWTERIESASGRGLSVSANPYWPTIEISPATGEPLIAYETYNVLPSGGAIHLKTPAAPDWQGIAGSATNEGLSNASGSAAHVSLAVEGAQIYAAWQEKRVSTTDIYVAAYSPEAGWQALGTSLGDGGISQSSNASERPTIRVRNSSIVVSWNEELSDGTRAYLRSYQEGVWTELAGSASGEGLSGVYSPAQHVDFDFDSQARPFVVWSHNADGENDIYAARWDGTRWVYPAYENGSISATPVRSDYPHVAIDSAGKVFVLWEEYLEPSRSAIYLRTLE